MSRLLKIFLAFCGTLGISTIALCSFLIVSNSSAEESYQKPETILATKIIQCGKKITLSDDFWTENKFK